MSPVLTCLLALVVYVLAAARLTRIITTDKVGEPLRVAAVDRFGGDSMMAFLFHCPWCFGWWVCAALAWPTAVVAGLPWWWGFGLWPAGSYLVGVLARLDGD
ncbi:DUF1360 domain-containing protein [Nocardia sp. CDC159]|uniref:DUF1360 domain-containing protein n=1 Tax=Nocardia pulmonis TaxID=2951408 RepID=A0A9X2IZY6_9NOCA|nr:MULTISPECIES: DUF1360 domain-containing protein [Nocardia]MCM6777908.1 DUF1360 domain-containing protein [Nocardia pulmonis]MCM6790921.1 DUF1360 domain-containing protein [Nocardia sp. CDC159]